MILLSVIRFIGGHCIFWLNLQIGKSYWMFPCRGDDGEELSSDDEDELVYSKTFERVNSTFYLSHLFTMVLVLPCRSFEGWNHSNCTYTRVFLLSLLRNPSVLTFYRDSLLFYYRTNSRESISNFVVFFRCKLNLMFHFDLLSGCQSSRQWLRSVQAEDFGARFLLRGTFSVREWRWQRGSRRNLKKKSFCGLKERP